MQKTKKIQFLFSQNNKKAIKIAEKLKTSKHNVVLKSYDAIPIIWIDDHCFTGIKEINKAIEELMEI